MADSCSAHSSQAGWRCNGCGALLCPDCVGTQQVGPVQLVACALCGEGVEELRQHRLMSGTLVERLPGAFLFPFRGQGLIGLFALALTNTVLSYGGACGAFIATGITLGSLFAVVRSSGRGADQLELGDFTDLYGDVILPVLRFVVATLPLWAGVVFGAVYGTPAMWVAVVVLSLAWVPMALLAAATSSGFLTMLNPALMFALVAKLGRDYLVYLGGLFACLVLAVVLGAFGLVLEQLPVPVLSRFLGWSMRLLPLMLMAHLGGLVLYLRGDTLGWGTPEEYLEPVLRGVEPRGVVRERETQAARAPRAPIDLGPDVEASSAFGGVDGVFAERPSFSGGPAAPRRAAPVALDPSALSAHAANDEVSEAGRAIRAAMQRGDGGEAIRQWEEAGRLVPELTVAELSWLGRSAASQQEDQVALAAFEAASWAGGGADVAGARVMLARLLAERLGRPGDARRWMQRVVDEAPGTDAARFAQSWLTKQA